MSFFEEAKSGFNELRNAFFLVRKNPSLLQYTVIPILLNFVVFVGFWLFFYSSFGDVVLYDGPGWGSGSWIGEWISSFCMVVSYLILFFSSFFMAFLLSFLLSGLVASPFLSKLSRATEQLSNKKDHGAKLSGKDKFFLFSSPFSFLKRQTGIQILGSSRAGFCICLKFALFLWSGSFQVISFPFLLKWEINFSYSLSSRWLVLELHIVSLLHHRKCDWFVLFCFNSQTEVFADSLNKINPFVGWGFRLKKSVFSSFGNIGSLLD